MTILLLHHTVNAKSSHTNMRYSFVPPMRVSQYELQLCSSHETKQASHKQAAQHPECVVQISIHKHQTSKSQIILKKATNPNSEETTHNYAKNHGHYRI